MSEKAKNDFHRSSVALFLILWCAGYGIAWPVGSLADWYTRVPDNLPNLVMIGVGGIIIALVQSLLLKYLLRFSALRWLACSVIGCLAGCVIFEIYYALRPEIGWSLHLGGALLFAAPGMASYGVIHSRFQKSWLWVLASAVSGYIFVYMYIFVLDHLPKNFDMTDISLAIAGATAGIVTGISILWLTRQRREKAKHMTV